MIIKITRMLALSGALLWSGVAMAQSGSPTGSPTGAPTGAPGGSEVAGAPGAPANEALLPAEGTGMVTEESTTITTEENLPATGGAPLLMALVGAMTAGGAMLGLKKMR
jgi:hypothetical protein